MATSNEQFQQFISQFGDDIQSLVQELQTWADNKFDANPAFDFTTAQTDLQTAKSNFETSAKTVSAL